MLCVIPSRWPKSALNARNTHHACIYKDDTLLDPCVVTHALVNPLNRSKRPQLTHHVRPRPLLLPHLLSREDDRLPSCRPSSPLHLKRHRQRRSILDLPVHLRLEELCVNPRQPTALNLQGGTLERERIEVGEMSEVDVFPCGVVAPRKSNISRMT